MSRKASGVSFYLGAEGSRAAEAEGKGATGSDGFKDGVAYEGIDLGYEGLINVCIEDGT